MSAAGHNHRHPHGLGLGHQHGHTRAGARHVGALRVAFALVVAFLVVQLVVGLATGSLALLSDAGHMATDALGLGMALAAIGVASRADTADHRTFGLYRIEILAALANAVLLFAVAGYVLVEALRRIGDPPHVATLPVLSVGVLGLAVNLVAFLLLRRGARESLNVRGAYLEVIADTLGSVGVIAAATVMWLTGWAWVDPVVGAGIGLLILPRAWSLAAESLRVLVQAAPAGLDLDEIHDVLAGVDGVVDVHDLHVWTLTSEMDVLTAHVSVADPAMSQHVLHAARALVGERFGLTHATLQVEVGPNLECDEMSW